MLKIISLQEIIVFKFQERVYREVMEVLGPDRMVEAEDLPHFQYTDRVIKETARLFPVGPLIVRDITDDLPIAGKI